MVRLIALLVLIGSLATPQEARRTLLTPQVAQGILSLAEQARTDTFGDRVEAVRVFRKAILEKYEIFWPCDPPPHHRRFYLCSYGPKSWYAEKLAEALRDGNSLTTVEARDEIVFVLVPTAKSTVAPETLTIEQGDALPIGRGMPRTYRVVTPFERTTPAMETEDPSGQVVVRVASAFHVRPGDLDFHSNGVHLSSADRSMSHHLSPGVLQDLRQR